MSSEKLEGFTFPKKCAVCGGDLGYGIMANEIGGMACVDWDNRWSALNNSVIACKIICKCSHCKVYPFIQVVFPPFYPMSCYKHGCEGMVILQQNNSIASVLADKKGFFCFAGKCDRCEKFYMVDWGENGQKIGSEYLKDERCFVVDMQDNTKNFFKYTFGMDVFEYREMVDDFFAVGGIPSAVVTSISEFPLLNASETLLVTVDVSYVKNSWGYYFARVTLPIYKNLTVNYPLHKDWEDVRSNFVAIK